MPRDNSIKKVLVIGSGPIVIGQAAEFDYAGTQACRSLKEEGVEVVLLNSNPATIMTDRDIADEVYIEPLTVNVLKKLIEKEKPDSILPTLGGQAGLNLAMEIAETDFLKEHNCRLIGTTALTIKKAEDRLAFKETMEKINEPIAPSKVVKNIPDGADFAKQIGYPVVLRPAYTLGGSGGGIAHNPQELHDILENGLRLSRVGEVLVEKCIAGWKEIEYEVMRDSAGNCITVCNMENLDPVGVHTGDSIVVAPSQTLSDKEYQMLRTSALNIITELEITGGCNVQYALNPESFEYCVIEVNPRVSRSSALASKATGYPIAKVAAKIALGYTLDEIKNAITGKTYASFEPTLDYCVVKIPRLPFDKFITAKRTLTTQMKATGEVMSICNNFEGALMKAIRSLEQHVESLLDYDFTGLSDDELVDQLEIVDDRRIWVIAEALRRRFSYKLIHKITMIDEWFIDKIAILTEMEEKLRTGIITEELLRDAKRIEFPDKVIARLAGKTEKEIYELRKKYGIVAAFKMVDTCAAEFEATTPYYYSVYGGENRPSTYTLTGKEEVTAIFQSVGNGGHGLSDTVGLKAPVLVDGTFSSEMLNQAGKLSQSLSIKNLVEAVKTGKVDPSALKDLYVSVDDRYWARLSDLTEDLMDTVQIGTKLNKVIDVPGHMEQYTEMVDTVIHTTRVVKNPAVVKAANVGANAGKGAVMIDGIYDLAENLRPTTTDKKDNKPGTRQYTYNQDVGTVPKSRKEYEESKRHTGPDR
jgi:carbamoyl-phosphate synthase large subunit